MALLVGIDLGTTGCKAAVYDGSGATLGESYLEYGLLTFSPVMIEQDPQAWWELTLKATVLALNAAACDRRAVAALSVSSQGISFLLLDAAGRPLGNAINWLDSRATDECAEILRRFSETEIFQTTGKRAMPFYVLPKLMWIRRHQPDVWRSARHLMMGHDYLLYRLCGAHVTDHSMAGGTLLYDLAAAGWNDAYLEAFQIPRDLLPGLCWSGSAIGTLLPEVAETLGLRPDTVVVVGGQDQKCAALGAGLQDGSASVSLGTASAIVQVMRSPRTDPLGRVPTFAYVQPGRWVLEGVIGTAAGSLRWYRDVVAPGESYARLDAEAAAVPPGSDGVFFYPHLGGAGSPYWLDNARGTFHGLSLATSRGHLTRAVLEGVAYQVRTNLAVTEEIAGPAGAVTVFGGGARSDLWRAILADVLAHSVAWTRTAETAGLGAAMLAGLGSGLFPSLADAQQEMLPARSSREPDPANVNAYSAGYERYRRTETALLVEAQAHRTPMV